MIRNTLPMMRNPKAILPSHSPKAKAEAQAKKNAMISTKRATTNRLTKPIVDLAMIRNIYSL